MEFNQTLQEWSFGLVFSIQSCLKNTFYAELWLPRQTEGENYNNLLVKNCWPYLYIIWYKLSLGDHLAKLLNPFDPSKTWLSGIKNTINRCQRQVCIILPPPPPPKKKKWPRLLSVLRWSFLCCCFIVFWCYSHCPGGVWFLVW